MDLKKGNKANLSVSKFKIGLGWDPSPRPGEDFDLDVSAFILSSNNKVLFDGSTLGEKYIVYFNSEDRVHPDDLDRNIFRYVPYDGVKYPNKEDDYRVKTRPTSPQFEVIGSLDDKDGRTSDGEDDEDMFIDLGRIHPDASQIVVVASIYDADDRKQNFGQVKNAYIRILDDVTGQEIIRYDLDEDFSFETAVEFGRIYKRNDVWRFEAMGNGTSGGLEFYIKKYSSFLN
jgi:tellurium resistance protein TerD